MNPAKTMTRERLKKAWDVIVRLGGARADEDEFDQFSRSVASAIHCDGSHEFRFQGIFGFGGKIRYRHYEDRFQVDYYPEDRTPERERALAVINPELERV